MREVTIGRTTIDDDSDPYVIAEIGGNHRGSVDDCKAIITAAAQAGCAAIKLQKRSNRDLYTPAAYNQPYNSENAWGPTYGEHREFLEFDFAQYTDLKQFTESYGLDFFATAFDLPSVAFLAQLGVPAIKIASGDLTSLPLIEEAAQVGVPLIISTGGGTMNNVRAAWFTSLAGRGGAAFLQCTAAYPCEAGALNLRAIETFREAMPDTVVGLSDHYSGIAMAPVAYTLGARIFEKHFTLHRAWRGSDQAFSLEPDGMRRMVRDLKRTREALGNGIKRRLEVEGAALDKMQKAWYYTADLPQGHVLTQDDVSLRSPGGFQTATPVIGAKLSRPVVAWEPVL